MRRMPDDFDHNTLSIGLRIAAPLAARTVTAVVTRCACALRVQQRTHLLPVMRRLMLMWVVLLLPVRTPTRVPAADAATQRHRRMLHGARRHARLLRPRVRPAGVTLRRQHRPHHLKPLPVGALRAKADQSEGDPIIKVEGAVELLRSAGD